MKVKIDGINKQIVEAIQDGDNVTIKTPDETITLVKTTSQLLADDKVIISYTIYEIEILELGIRDTVSPWVTNGRACFTNSNGRIIFSLLND